MQARAFNSVSIDYKNNIFTKSSHNIKKLRNEINYYLNLPRHLAQLFPRLIDYKYDYSSYRMEYLPYNNLANSILSNQLSVQESEIILQELVDTIEQIHQVKPQVYKASTEVSNFYIDKTLNRLDQLQNDEFFYQLVQQPSLTINDKLYKGFVSLKEEFIKKIQENSLKHNNIAAMHGDFCFSNILYCRQHGIKLIDPRGSFIDKGIYGHTYYDYAKLLHCLHGKYDFVVLDQFELKQFNPTCFEFEVPSSSILDSLHRTYISLLKAREINLEFLYLIEASLFLSMATLHYENKQRQIVFFLKGLIILNKVMEGKYENMY